MSLWLLRALKVNVNKSPAMTRPAFAPLSMLCVLFLSAVAYRDWRQFRLFCLLETRFSRCAVLCFEPHSSRVGSHYYVHSAQCGAIQSFEWNYANALILTSREPQTKQKSERFSIRNEQRESNTRSTRRHCVQYCIFVLYI